MHEYVALNKKTYNAIAEKFAKTREYPWAEIEPFAAFVSPSDAVLDIGCGNGRVYQLFAKKQVRYVGVDQSEELVAIAEKTYPDATWIVGEMTALLFDEASFDLVLAIASLQHMPTPDLRLSALKEMARVAKNGAHICLTNWNLYSKTARQRHAAFAPGDFFIPWKSDVDGATLGERYYHGFTPDELSDLAQEAGLTVVDQYYVGPKGKTDQEKGRNLVSIFYCARS